MPVLAGAGVLAIAALGWLAFRGRAVAPAVPLERVQLTFTGNASTPALSPDGRRMAYTTRQCDTAGLCTEDVVVQDIGGAGSATVLRGATAVWRIEWSADARYLLLNASYGSGSWGVFSIPSLGGEPRFLGCCEGEVAAGSDTALVARGPNVGDSIGWVRWVMIGDGIAHDSLPIRAPGGAQLRAELFPDGTRLLLRKQHPGSEDMFVLDRTGAVLDSLVFSRPQVPEEAWLSPDGRGLLVLLPRLRSTAEVDLLRYRIDGSGRFDTTPETLARQLGVNAGASIGRTGALAYGYGPTEYSVWALRRRTPTSMDFTQRRLATSTALLTASLSPPGDQVLLWRPVPTGDGRQQLSVMPFDSGPETPVGPPVDNRDFDWTQDGAAVVMATRRGADSLAISRVEVPSGRTTPLATVPSLDYLLLETVDGGGFIMLPTGQSFRRVGLPGLPDSTIRLPDAIGTLQSIDPSPDGRAFVSISWDPAFDSILVHRVSAVDGSMTRLASFGAEGSQPPRWLDDGSIIVSIFETSWTMAWYRVPAAGGRPERVGTPPRYPASYRFSGDGLRVMARSQDRRTDIYLVPNFGEVLKE